jgi:hypothetical protein
MKGAADKPPALRVSSGGQEGLLFVNKKKQKNFWLLSDYPLVGVTPRPNCPQHAGVSKQVALF